MLEELATLPVDELADWDEVDCWEDWVWVNDWVCWVGWTCGEIVYWFEMLIAELLVNVLTFSQPQL